MNTEDYDCLVLVGDSALEYTRCVCFLQCSFGCAECTYGEVFEDTFPLVSDHSPDIKRSFNLTLARGLDSLPTIRQYTTVRHDTSQQFWDQDEGWSIIMDS